MIKEFEGKTEQEAIDKAVEELQLDRDEFDVEVLEEQKGGLFRKGNVKIRIHIDDSQYEEVEEPEGETEKAIADFITMMISKMGFEGNVYIAGREERKVVYGIDSEHSNILIGKKGKNLDAIQMLANVYAGKIGCGTRVIVDIEDYRGRREEKIIRMATRVGQQVRKSRSSRLLEPMNPFERRLIHTTLSEMDDIETKSEGEGLYKQVRVIYKGSSF